MADEPVLGRSEQAPDFLTVDQTSDVLQLGRSTTYELVGLYVESEGADGIPAVMCGGQYRIPRARLEAWHGGPISWPPAKRPRRRRSKRAAGDIQGCAAESPTVGTSGRDEPADGEAGGQRAGAGPEPSPVDEAPDPGEAPAALDLAGDEPSSASATSGQHLSDQQGPDHGHHTSQLDQPTLPFEG